MIAAALLVLRQLLVLTTISAGSGCWLWWVVGARRWERAHIYLWFGIGGLCCSALGVQAFVYCGVPVRLTAWPLLIVCVGGLIFGARKNAGRLFRSKEARLYGLVFAGIFFGQSPGLFLLGPARYYGSGQFDHANYIVTAEFLRSEPFAMPEADLGYRPWMQKALQIKEQRITECVLLAALAEIDRSSAQEAYGTLSVFFVALAGIATTAWLRTMGFSRGGAGWAGLAAALTPAFTRIHLDAFFSQTATLFVYPALAGVLSGRGSLTRGNQLCAAAFLGFFIGSYSEVAIFGATLAAALVLVQGRPWGARIADLATIFGGALALNLGYLQRFTQYLIETTATALHPDALDGLFPESGSWLGWGRMFANFPSSAVVVAVGLGVAALGCWSVKTIPPVRRRSWLTVLGVALMPVLLLRLAPEFHRYPFGKLTVQFLPVWLSAALAGWVGLVVRWRSARRVNCIAAVATLVAIWATTWPQHTRIFRPTGRLALLSSEEFLGVRRDTEGHRERAYLVAHGDALVALWLCYFGRGSPTVLERRALGDRLVSTETYAFRRWTPAVGPLWWLDPDRKGPIENYEPPPQVKVEGARRIKAKSGDDQYVVTRAADFVFSRPQEGKAMRLVWLDFFAIPVPAGPAVTLRLENYAHSQQEVVVSASGWQRWLVPLPLGETTCRLEVVSHAGEGAPAASVVLTLLSVEVSLELRPNDPAPIGGIEAR